MRLKKHRIWKMVGQELNLSSFSFFLFCLCSLFVLVSSSVNDGNIYSILCEERLTKTWIFTIVDNRFFKVIESNRIGSNGTKRQKNFIFFFFSVTLKLSFALDLFYLNHNNSYSFLVVQCNSCIMHNGFSQCITFVFCLDGIHNSDKKQKDLKM